MPNISKFKGNYQQNFVSYQNIICETFFLKNHRQNLVEKLVPDRFLKLKLSVYLDQQSEILYSSFFLFCPSRGLPKYTKSTTTCFSSYKSFLINKDRSGTGMETTYLIFCMIVEEKYFSCYNLLTDHISLSDCLYFLKYLAILEILGILQLSVS